MSAVAKKTPKIAFHDGLHEVDRRKIPIDTKALRKAIDDAVKALGIEPMWLAQPTFYDAKGRYHYGIAFGISKFDGNFTTHPTPNTFSYRDAEVQDALRKIIEAHPECAPLVRWDRAFGVFVFNVYLWG